MESFGDANEKCQHLLANVRAEMLEITGHVGQGCKEICMKEFVLEQKNVSEKMFEYKIFQKKCLSIKCDSQLENVLYIAIKSEVLTRVLEMLNCSARITTSTMRPPREISVRIFSLYQMTFFTVWNECGI